MNTMNQNRMNEIKNSFKFDTFKQKADSYRSRVIVYVSTILEELKWKKLLQEAGVPKTHEIFTYTNIRELKALYELASNCSQGAVALEIGSHLGASSCYIAAGLKKVDGHLFCVDTWQNETMPEGELDTFTEFQKNTNGVKQQITQVRKRSEEIDADDFQVPLNFVFIDGDHSYTAVKRDFESLEKFLAEDAIIAFHDFSNIYFEGVTRFVGEALASGNWMIAGYVDTLVWIKRAKWLDPTWISNS